MTDKKPIKQYSTQSIEFSINKSEGISIVEKSMTGGLYCNYCGKYVDNCTTQGCPYFRNENNTPSRLYKKP